MPDLLERPRAALADCATVLCACVEVCSIAVSSNRSRNKEASMPVWFMTRGRRARTPAPLSRPRAAHVLIALVLGLALLGGQYRSPDPSVAASAVADQQEKDPSASTDDARMRSQGCLPDGTGSLKVVLSGALDHNIEWQDDDLDCGGSNGTLQFGGVPAGADARVDLNFKIEVEEGATGTDLLARVTIYDQGSGSNFAMSESGCTVNVTEQSLIEENPAYRTYRMVANGSCAEPLNQLSGPGAGVGRITVGSFDFVGLAFWQ